MKLLELSKEEFQGFSENHPQMTFLQSPCWGELKHQNGWDVVYLGVKKDKKILAGCMMLSKMTPVKKRMFYAPRGFLIDYDDADLLREFTLLIRDYVKQHDGIFFKIDPYLIHKQRDRDGQVVEGGIDHSDVKNRLIQLGYLPQWTKITDQSLQAQWMYTLDLKDKSLEQVMKEMDPKTRQMIRKNEKNGVVVRQGTREDVRLFADIMKHTSERRDFLGRSYEYYLHMYDSFCQEGKFLLMIAEIHPQEQLNLLKQEEKDLQAEYDTRKKEHDTQERKMKEDKYQQRQKDTEEQLQRLQKQQEKMRELADEYGEVLPLGAIIYMLYGGEVLSFYGGAYEKFLNFQPFYTLHYEMIRYAIDHGYQTYNFYGIHGNLVKEDPMYGVYLFKRGFGGQVVELIGEFDYPVSLFWYQVYKISYDVVHKAKQWKMKLTHVTKK